MKLKDKLKQKGTKRNFFNIFLSIIVSLGVYYLFKITNANLGAWFFMIVALLLLIYFELLEKK